MKGRISVNKIERLLIISLKSEVHKILNTKIFLSNYPSRTVRNVYPESRMLSIIFQKQKNVINWRIIFSLRWWENPIILKRHVKYFIISQIYKYDISNTINHHSTYSLSIDSDFKMLET